MVTVLRVLVDAMVDPSSRGAARYTEELTRALIATAPRGCAVEGLVSASPEPDYDSILEKLPGLTTLTKSALARRELRAAWQHGITVFPGSGMIHAPTLLAPLHRGSSRGPGDQTVVTVHDAAPLTEPAASGDRRTSWYRAMLKRAERYADAVVAPSHAVAEVLRERTTLAERVRIVPGAVSSHLRVPDDDEERRSRLGLPSDYVFTLADLTPRKRLAELLVAMRDLELPLVVGGDPARNGESLDAAIAAAGIRADRVIVLGDLGDDDLATAYAAARVFVHPGQGEGFGLPVLEAFSLGTPVVISNDPALLEVALDAARIAPSDDDVAEALRGAIVDVLEDPELAERLVVLGGDRAGAFSWRDSAEKTWQLHADL